MSGKHITYGFIALLFALVLLGGGNSAKSQELPQCIPVSTMADSVRTAEPGVDIRVFNDKGFAKVFTDALEVPTPEGSEVVGLLTGRGEKTGFVGLLEPGDCVRWWIVVDRPLFDAAMLAGIRSGA